MSAPPLRFEPALEGLRGAAVLAVLLFHAELGWARGGYLGVSAFFTLSGFLITSLLLGERESSGRVDLTRFWARRFRRLMPAALLTLLAIACIEPRLSTPAGLANLRGDVLWALGYAANWRLLDSDVAYTQIFLAPSLVQHFWSLAIEEQFYVVFPLLFAALARFGRASLLAAFAGGACASVGIGWWSFESGASLDRIYYGTDTRAAEFLLGGCLAGVRGRLYGVGVGGQRAIEGVGLVAAIASLGLWASVPVDSGWLYRGGLAAYAMATVAVLAAAVQPHGAVRVVLATAPLRWIGRVSYGAYLYHWPLYLWASDANLGFGGAAAIALRIGATLALAGASYRFVEEPIRRGRSLRGWRSPAAAGAMAIAVTVAALAIPTQSGLPHQSDFPHEKHAADETASVAAAAPRIALFGDSTALRLDVGLQRWTRESGQARPGRGVHLSGCGVGQGGWRRHRGRVARVPKVCETREAQWSDHLADPAPDVIVVLTGTWEVADRRLAGDDVWRKLGDPVYDDYLRGELLRAVDLLASQGALVVWLTHPRPTLTPGPRRAGDGSFDPVRSERWNELVRSLPELRPESVRVVDFAAIVAALPATVAGAPARPDGIHLTSQAAYEITRAALGPALVAAHREAARR